MVEKTLIQVEKTVQLALHKLKDYPGVSYNMVIERLIENDRSRENI